MLRKQLLLLFMLPMLPLMAQFTLSGHVTNDLGENLESATVFVVDSDTHGAATDSRGMYKLEGLPEGMYTVKCSYVGYQDLVRKVSITADTQLDFLLAGAIYGLDSIEIKSNRVGDQAVYAHDNITSVDIDDQNVGKDMPYMLRMSPSVVVTSDAGNGVGYTGVRIRGTEASRVNVTINGISLNDSESQGVFWVNLPDFASSVKDIQIQRGVGPSTIGAGAFGANVSLNTLQTHVKPGVLVDAAYGSYDTRKLTVAAHSGLINEKYSVDVRYSDIQSDGYVDRASSDLSSYYVSAARITDKSSLRFITFAGDERTYQSWYGTPQDSLATNRKYNYYTYENQVDNYGQDHYQLHWSLKATDQWVTRLTGHYTRGLGYFEEFKDGEDFSEYLIDSLNTDMGFVKNSDLVRRRWLDNHFYGFNWTNRLNLKAVTLDFGAAANQYKGDHYGRIVDFPLLSGFELDRERNYYFSDATKNEISGFVRAAYPVGALNLTADMQVRNVHYETQGRDSDQTPIDINRDFTFFNPKVGANYKLNDQDQVYAVFGIANKEPDRKDFIDYPTDKQPESERLYDVELGYKKAASGYSFGVNAYWMQYKNQLIPTGALNDVGSPIRLNVDNSYRRGLELVGGVMLTEALKWEANLTLSENKIVDFQEEFEGMTTTYDKTDIAFSPNIIAASQLSYEWPFGLELGLNSKYVGKQYLDNSTSDNKSIDAYFVNDLVAGYTRPLGAGEVMLQLSIFNLFNKLYEANGYTYSYSLSPTEISVNNFYYPQAERNAMVRLKFRF